MDLFADVASGLAVLLLVAREFRLGAGAATDRLVKTLQTTIEAQAGQISLLLKDVERLKVENAELRSTVEVLMRRQEGRYSATDGNHGSHG